MSRQPYRFAGRTAVLTGAASGIGEQLAHGLAVRGSDLVLLDRDGTRLDQVVERIRAAHPGVAVQAVIVDLADRDATVAAAERIAAEHPRIGLLINNAGVALGGLFEQMTVDEFEWVMDVNFRAPLLLTHHLLPSLLAEPGSHLVNLSSLFGLIAPGGQTAYAASKFALRGLSQALRAELGVHGTGVTTVHPGGIRTRIAESARMAAGAPSTELEQGRESFAKLLDYPPEKAAEEILRGVERRKARVLITPEARVLDALARLLPAGHIALLAAVTNRGRATPERGRAAPSAPERS
ncbi:SDR family NAD(P)-dependent oxidoreductase [Pseudonocardia humida]|uniref:SDR family NAD(P)-dependent oxidoreductase n=1 Tax=Pseudonocardia humida TaxID=2800819 RepID=A0ABT1ADJ7_9PSEU|nr:SDR family NAD(P)-dependent oxidoreductase [Pseudonocardia humida]MCO1661141.1 SDR family NAD(P)-dependent oxidoreductase [Pseudonocardia humida]